MHEKVLSDSQGSESQAINPGGEAMEEKDIKALIKSALSEKGEGEKSGLAEAFKGIADRLDKQGEQLDDFCTRFPELCGKVESIEKTLQTPKLDHGSDEWKAARKADLEHILLQNCPECTPWKAARKADLEHILLQNCPECTPWKAARKADLEHILLQNCPECTPVRDEVLATSGKRLADIEPETKGDEEGKTEEEVNSEEAEVEQPELKTSPGYREGYKWDPEKELYVEKR
jgi:hypothetical protein